MKGGILTALVVFCTPIFGFANPLKSFLQQAGVSQNKTAVYAVWADTGEPILAHNEDQPLIPASALKIVTAYCALKKLGPAYHFETRVLSEGPIQQGSVQNLTIQGEGDPSLVSERLWVLIQELKARGLKKIVQNIYLDDSYFAAQEYPGRQGNNHRAYNALTSALAVNFNSVPYYQNGEKHYRRAQRPLDYFAGELAAQLKVHHIAFTGKILEGKTATARLLYSFPSKPLGLIVHDMNKYSNNFIAEQLVKHLGAKLLSPPGTTAKGIHVLNDCLNKAGVEISQASLKNGSGFSLQNKISAKALVLVLLAGWRDFTLRPEFTASLSVAGLDGTMEKRKIPKELEGVLRAKTGSLNGVNSLSGFVPAKNGRLIAFAILMNDYKKDMGEAQKIQDRLIVQLRN
ncbi:MAG: D-alanyl-D-alanine carboxypeptidase/D-alanyl-D-alanine-endopeptidase [Deltaproteobacteria bacterium]|nr:D-alanyl-D-alanine carboxypeptidase/D-alanyl-D-alanine-endopeptidase [Deltaproteobacteria bacterium]MBI4224065.1 D-alanyl-D-alanine carboxypeptidase/D-alanyl-D-alanine-endopeptidase [Deltaproteobacteria bacterium]